MRRPDTLLLFDIDGTLVSWAGISAGVFHAALAEAAGFPVGSEDYSFAGRTDPEIARDLLRRAGVPEERLDACVLAALAGYADRLAAVAPASTRARVLPGVGAVLERLASFSDVVVGLLTGNIEAGARIKLEHFDLFHHFEIGAYGSDDADRRALVPIAIERARALDGRCVVAERVVIIGDTPNDVACARAHGLRSVAVATGPFDAVTLLAAGADVVLDDFSDTQHVIDVLLGNGKGR